ncbi:MAG: PDZ domain-containing protein [Planctomycetota bacterium]
MKPHRFLFPALTLAGAAALASTAAAALSVYPSAAWQAESTGESNTCQCTCADCIAKHGPKADPASVKPQAPTLPELGPDVEAEVAKVLAMDLDQVDQLLVDVTNGSEDSEDRDTEPSEAPASKGERGYMGISLAAGMDRAGAVVGDVTPGSPADRAGLREGDVIVVAEEYPIDSAEDLIAALIDLKVGDTASLELERGDKEWAVDIVLGPRIEPQPALAAEDVLVEEVAPEVIEEVAEVEEEVELPREVRTLRQLGYAEAPSGDEEEVRVQLTIAGDRDLKLPGGLSDEMEARVRRLVEERLRDRQRGGAGTSRQIMVFEVEADDATAGDARRDEIEESERRVIRRGARTRRGARRESRQVERPRARRRGRADDRGYIEIETRRERRPASESDLRRRIDELEAEVAELTRVLDRIQAELDRRNPR